MNPTGKKEEPFLKKTKGILNREGLRILSLVLVLLFAVSPLLTILFQMKGQDFSYVFSDSSFPHALGNSLLYSFVGAFLATLLALFIGFFLDRSNIRYKKVYIILLTLPMLVPSLSIGLGIKNLFGEKGWLDILFGWKSSVSSLFSLILGATIMAFPTAFFVVYDALRYENKNSYDAAKTLGVKGLRNFFHITLPYIKTPLISGFFAAFTLIFSDYGLPMEVAGSYKTLPMYLYEQVMSSYQYGRASIIGFFLLIPAVVSFFFEILMKENSSGEAHSGLIPPTKKFNVLTLVFVLLLSFLLFVPQLSFISLAFVKNFPNDMHFTWEHMSSIFSNQYGVGIGKYIGNSLSISLLTGFFGTAIAFAFAYLSTRLPGVIGKILHVFSIASLAIPGIVLGIGYVFFFSPTNGWLYGTLGILVLANIVHFFGTPYIMARNSLAKQNPDYEMVGSSLGVSKWQVFLGVLVPNSAGTLVEMFSYFFLNSMVTISAVAFLCTYSTQPLSILITTFDKTGNYEMQAVVSVVILFINILFKGLFIVLTHLCNRSKEEKEGFMPLDKYSFDLLTFLENRGKGKYSQRYLSDMITVSVGTINKTIKEMFSLGYIQISSDEEMAISEQGLKALEPYKVRKAIIIAAGFGSRMAPVTLDTPKPLVKVNGKRILDTLLDALVEKGITDIIIVRGYKKEAFDQLLEKYPFIKFVDNNEYNVTNNISSLMKVLDSLDSCYICEADLIVSNKNLIRKYEYSSNYLGAKVVETDDWCFTKSGNFIAKYQQGGENCYQAYGISFWTREDCQKLKIDIPKVYNSHAGKDNFWDNVPFKYCKKDYKVEVRTCYKTDICEIDNFSELVALDPSYANYPGHEKY
jgi:iron(III) transport system permease protein